jgi:hypothetical protein
MGKAVGDVAMAQIKVKEAPAKKEKGSLVYRAVV